MSRNSSPVARAVVLTLAVVLVLRRGRWLRSYFDNALYALTWG
jgi:hypothetical protein